jgi:hypothetical protein
MIIELGSSPDQSRQINHLLAGRSFGEGQVEIRSADDEIGAGLLHARGGNPHIVVYCRAASVIRFFKIVSWNTSHQGRSASETASAVACRNVWGSATTGRS